MAAELDEKTGRRVVHACRVRVLDVEKALLSSHASVLEERRHSDPSSQERGYYTAGYLRAMKDVLSLLETGSLPELR